MITSIHQVWIQGREHFQETQPVMYQCSQKWTELYPEWTHKVWGEAECLSDLEAYSPKLLKAYKLAPSYSAKSDILRFLLLYLHGGMYADTDYEPLQRCDWLLQGDVNLAVSQMSIPKAKVTIGNFHPDMPCGTAWLYARPGNRYLKAQLDRIADTPFPSSGMSKEAYAWSLTGPKGLGQVLTDHQIWQQPDVRVLPSSMMELADFTHLEPTFQKLEDVKKEHPYAVGLHRCNGSWMEGIKDGAVTSTFGRLYSAINEWWDFVVVGVVVAMCLVTIVSTMLAYRIGLKRGLKIKHDDR